MASRKRRSRPDYAALGRKGGPARMAALTSQERTVLARQAARARWKGTTAAERSEAQRKRVLARWRKARRA